MSALPRHLLPMTATVDGGRLSIGGCDVGDLAAKYGTPVFVYDELHVRERCREAVATFGDGATYASKAFLCLAMARLVKEEGMGIDVSTGGELYVALEAQMPPARITLHGNNKSEAELGMAMAAGIGRIVLDSDHELDRIERLVAEHGFEPPKILVRVTPGVEAHTHEYVMTGQDDTKFGFGLASGAAAAAVERATASPAVELVGIHAHIGSNIFLLSGFERAVEVLAPFVKPLGLPELCLGGGLGVAYVEGEETPTFAEWGGLLRQAIAAAGIDAKLKVEPGRSIVAGAAVTLYTVGTIKHLPGIRTYVAVDGGMSDNPRPVLYGSGYEAFLPRSTDADRPLTATIVGKHCESGDVLVRDARLPADLAVGDVLATPVTGAYGHSMASNYNKVPRPPIVFVRDGEDELVVRRETLEDLLYLDL
jgi:diaminopimelate decarboxylase